MTNTILTAIAATILATTGAPLLRAGAPVRPGEQRRWALDFRVRLEQAEGGRPIEIHLTGDWISTIAAVRTGGYDAMLQLVNARISSVAGSAPADADERLRMRLARPFWATYSDEGSLVTVHFYKDTDPADRNLLQTIATECQFVQGGPDRPQWTVLERDGAGQYLSIYNRWVPNEVVKRKLKYIRTDGASGAPVGRLRIDIDQSELHFSLDSDGEIFSLDGNNKVRLGALGNASQLTTVTQTHLAGLRKNQAPESMGSLERALRHVVSLPVVTHPPDPDQLRAQLDDQLIEGYTTESLLSAALAMGEDHMLADRLEALFRRRPDAPSGALAILRKIGPQKRITDALGSAGSPQAIGALAALARDWALPPPLRIDALTALILVQHPSVEAMRLPLGLLDDGDARIASAARMVSGALARAGRAAHSSEAQALDVALIVHYRKAQTVEEASTLLAALGNSVGNSVLLVIEGALRDPREPIRVAAAQALRLAEGSEIANLLAATITNDEAPRVRASAIFAASFHHPIVPVIGEALMSAARSDSAESVRAKAIALLRRNADASPQIAETLSWVAEHDADPSVRLLAREALAPGQ